MKNTIVQLKLQIQRFPYHLVDTSPWLILVSFSLFTMAIGAVMYMYGYANGGSILIIEALKLADNNKISSTGPTPLRGGREEVKKRINENVGESSSASNFMPTSQDDHSNLVFKLIDGIMDQFSSIFTPSTVSGYLDDLIGQQIAIQFIVLFVSISVLLLVIACFINILLLINKDYIIKHFSQNKLIQFYLKYQVLSIKISLFVLPVFIFIGLFTLIQSSYYMITHPVPYDLLGVDFHVYVDTK